MIYFVRHGETDYNKRRLIAGGGVDIPLNDNGISQAERAKKLLKDVQFDIAFSSPMIRARQTLDIVLGSHDETPKIIDERLRERLFGVIDGTSEDAYGNFWSLDKYLNYSGCEQITDVYDRVSLFYDELMRYYPKSNILIAAHNGIARVSRCYFKGFPKSGNLQEYSMNNAEIIRLD